MLQERIWRGGFRGRECLSVRDSGRGLVYRGLMCRSRLWKRAPLPIGAPLGRMGGGVRSSGTLRDSWRWALEKEHSSLWALCEGNLEEGFFTEDPEGYVEKALETGISVGAPLGNLEGGSFTRDFERWMRGNLGGGASLRELCEGTCWGGLHYWEPREDM